MLGLKIYNGLNGLLYSLYGIIGVFMPAVVFEANALNAISVHGSHSIRGLWGAVCVLGIIILWKGLKLETARATTMMIAMVSAGLAVARLLGVAIDGTEGWLSDQYGPLVIESTMAVVGGFLYARSK